MKKIDRGRLCFFILSLMAFPILAQVTVNEVIAKIKSEVTCDWAAQTVDNIKAGDGNTVVTGIATTFMATLDVLKKAKALGCNFIITHEPTFYSHTDDLTLHEGDPVQEAKLKYIRDNGLVVWRFHDHLHRTNPDQVYEGVLDRLGWKAYTMSSWHIIDIPEKSLKKVVKELEQKMKAKTIRVVGNPNTKISKVGLVLGAAGSGAHFNMLKNKDCQLLIVGESNEWETVPYVQDAISEGQQRALIVMGHADSEESGMGYCRDWLKKFYPSMKIEFVEAGNPYWRN